MESPRFIGTRLVVWIMAWLLLPGQANADSIREAVVRGDLAAVQRFVKADPGVVNSRTRPGEVDGWEVGATPLHAAARNGHLDVAKFLLAHGADSNAQRRDGESALGEAAYNDRLEVAELLIHSGIKMNLPGQDGCTPLHWAAERASAAMVNLLAASGADVMARRADGGTPLHAAALKGNVATMQVLLDKQALLEANDSSGQTPLHIAAAQGQGEAVTLLIDKGGKPAATDKQGKTPIDLALDRGNIAIVERLLAKRRVTLHVENASPAEALKQLLTAAKVAYPVHSSLTDALNLQVSDVPFPLALKLLVASAGGGLAYENKAGVLELIKTQPSQPQAGTEEPVLTNNSRYRFLKRITRQVLNNYLARAVTHYGLCSTSPEPASAYFEEDMRMLTGLGAKFIGRAAYAWVPPDDDEAHYRLAWERALRVHTLDPEIILQAAVFEAVYESVGKIPVPEWIFTEFHLPVEKRNFRYEAMLYTNGKFRNHWTQGASVPDMSQLETRLYFYYRARRYIDAGFEAIHFGQVELMDHQDPNHHGWLDMLTRVRRYAALHARRRMVLCDAHTHGIVEDGRLLFDFHSYPLMARDVRSSPQKVELILGYYNSIYGRSAGGITPSGWSCANLPYLCEFDCGGSSDKPGQPSKFPWNWGYDCGTWFAHQSAQYRREYLAYARTWLRARDEDAWLQMPTRLNLAILVEGVKMWHANTRSKACPEGFDMEETIQAIWKKEER